MNIELTQYAIDRHFDPNGAGTVIKDRSPEDFERQMNHWLWSDSEPLRINVWRDGYAPFCKLAFLENWTDACTGTLPITPQNKRFLKSEYKSRKPEELPVLVRWFEGLGNVPQAKFLCLVLYDKEQLSKGGTDINADYGIVAILGQMHDREEPINPITMMRNALGVEEGGSGVSIDREAYARSVEFWNHNAAVLENR